MHADGIPHLRLPLLPPFPRPSLPTHCSYLTSDVSEQGLLAVPCIVGQLAQIFMGAAFAPWLARMVARKDAAAAAAAAAGAAAAAEDGGAGLQQGGGASSSSSSSIDTGKGSEGACALKGGSASEIEIKLSAAAAAAGGGKGAVAPTADDGAHPELQQVQVEVTPGKDS